nr:MAG TPA: hypothetical protein [Caudoviricetes sp.]
MAIAYFFRKKIVIVDNFFIYSVDSLLNFTYFCP